MVVWAHSIPEIIPIGKWLTLSIGERGSVGEKGLGMSCPLPSIPCAFHAFSVLDPATSGA